MLLYYYTNYMGDRGGKTTTGLVIDLRKIPLVLVIYTVDSAYLQSLFVRENFAIKWILR